MSSLEVYSSTHYISTFKAVRKIQIARRIKKWGRLLVIFLLTLVLTQGVFVLQLSIKKSDALRSFKETSSQLELLEIEIASQMVNISQDVGMNNENEFLPVEELSFIRLDSEVVYEKTISVP